MTVIAEKEVFGLKYKHTCLQLLVTLLLFTSSMSEEQCRPVCATEACKETAKKILEYMDENVKPCDDFYRFACGTFLNTAIIRDDKTKNSSFCEVSDLLDEQLKTLTNENVKPDEPLPFRNLKNLFSLCLDEEKINARGIDHALSRLKEAGGWPVLGNWNGDNWNLLETKIQLYNLHIGGDNLFSSYVSVDYKNSTRRIIKLDQARLGLPREFLIKGEEEPFVKAYFSYMVDLAVMYGADRQRANDQLRESLLFEIELAKICTRKEDRRDYERMYNPYELQKLISEIGWIDWVHLFKSTMPNTVQLRENELFIVLEVGFLEQLEHFLAKYSNEVIANYMMWHAARRMSVSLTNEMRNRKFEYDKELTGRKSREPRWKECVNVDSSLSLALSSLYVQKFFDETSKKEALVLTDLIRQEIIIDFKELDWMDDKTRENAEFKASKIVKHIGFPNELVDISSLEHHYNGLTINNEQYFEALTDLSKWALRRSFERLREEVNKTDWRTHGRVAVVNAFYNPTENSMYFPAGILQQPFFNAKVPKYINFGRMGVIMAHEVTHGFDDKGSQFNWDGELMDWWDPVSKTKFKEKTKCIIDQYSGFKDTQTQLNLNGVNTQGENVADVGGFKLAYRAYRRLVDQLTEPEPLLPGLEKYNQDQLFMLSMANMWCTQYKTKILKYTITTNVHSPAEFRVNGMIMNLPQFSKIFKCDEGDTMNPRDKCPVW